MRIAVGSKNPIKIAAVKHGFEKMMPGLTFDVIGYDVKSGVSHQPLSFEETIRGAKNRAKAALAQDETAAYGVGVEGGLEQTDSRWYDTQQTVIMSRSGVINEGQSIRIPIPDSFMNDILGGKELGDVIDVVFKKQNLKQAEGYIGEVTHGLISREDMTLGGVIAALIPFTNPELFGQNKTA